MSGKFVKLSKLEPDYLYGEEFRMITEQVVPNIYDYYMISNKGRVWHRYLGKIMSPGTASGYEYVALSTCFGPKNNQIHRLVMMTFCPIVNPSLYEVNHKDGNKHNNDITNLEWATHKENVDHSYSINLHPKEENSALSKITREEAIQVSNLLKENKYTNKQIASIVGNNVSENIVSSIKNKESWKTVTEDFDFYQRPYRLFEDQDIENFCTYFQNSPISFNVAKEQCKAALNYFGFEATEKELDTVRKVYSKKYYKNIVCRYNF